MALDIGVVLQTNPPALDVVAQAVRADELGFSHVWTFDSHVLWQEPYVIYSQILGRTERVTVGPMVTNPGTRDWTVTASLFATLDEMFGARTVCGIGRGDSARRYQGDQPVTLAELGTAIEVIRGLVRGEEVAYGDATLEFPWWPGEPTFEVWMAAYGPKALALCGQVADGFILQLADPDVTAWMVRAVREAAEGAGRDPDALTICVAAPAYVGDDLPHMRDQCRWFGGMVGNHVADIVARYGADGVRSAPGPHRLHRGPQGLRLRRARPGGQPPHGVRARRDRRPVLHPRPGRRPSSSAWPSSRRWVSTSSPSTSSTTP